MTEKSSIDLSGISSVYDLLAVAVTQLSQEEAEAVIALAKERLLPSLADAAAPPESGISENFYYYDPDGVKHQFTLRASTAAEFGSLLLTSNALRLTLQAAGWQPTPKPAPKPTRQPSTPAGAVVTGAADKKVVTTEAPAKAKGKAATPPPAQANTSGEKFPLADPNDPQPGEYGFYDCDVMAVSPAGKGKLKLEFYAPDLQYPVFREIATPEKLVEALANTGAWTVAMLKEAAAEATEFEIAYRVIYQYSAKDRRTSEGNLYKDLVKIRLIG